MTQSATSSVSQSVEQLPAGGNIPADNATSINDRHVPKANETGELISNSGTGEANKPHGNAGNRHRLRHGLKASRLPKGCGHVERSITAFRQQLEAAVLDIKPEISVRDAAYVQSACRHEQRASLLFHWLRTAERSGETLGTLERASLLRDISAATDSRDKCIERLGLDRDDADDLTTIYAKREATV